ncbi:MAG: hypothetical protein AAF804_19300, partial [Bacteroidota bacterium]
FRFFEPASIVSVSIPGFTITYSGLLTLMNNIQLLLLSFLFTCFSLSCEVYGQVFFQAKLVHQEDQRAMAFLTVRLQETGENTLSNEAGIVRFYLPQAKDTLHLQISGLGLREEITYRPTYRGTEVIQLEPRVAQLDEVLLEGLSARQVVAKAVAAIPDNYLSESHASHGFYRQYHRINGQYRNLIEAKTVVLHQRQAEEKSLKFDLAYALPMLRRSEMSYYVDASAYGEGMSFLMLHNFAYQLNSTTLHPSFYHLMDFSFDTITQARYVISYSCPSYTSEYHGVSNFEEVDLRGEGREYGRITIDRDSWAILRYERIARRNHDFDYPHANNFVLPSRRYRLYFDSGYLLVEYGQSGEHWILKRILHRFSNDYVHVRRNRLAYTIEEFYEWHTDYLTKQVEAELVDSFVRHPNLSHLPYHYQPQAWQEIPDFFFDLKEKIYADLSQESDLSEQFERQGSRNK